MRFLFTILLFSVSLSCFSQSSKTTSYNLTSFSSYYFKSNNDSLQPESHYLNDAILKSRIIKAIDFELSKIGYTKTKEIPSSLSVEFIVFSKPTRIHSDNLVDTGNPGNIIYTNLRNVYNIDPGTLLITFKQGEQIAWQGFSSRLINTQATVIQEEAATESVKMIMKEYIATVNNQSQRLSID